MEQARSRLPSYETRPACRRGQTPPSGYLPRRQGHGRRQGKQSTPKARVRFAPREGTAATCDIKDLCALQIYFPVYVQRRGLVRWATCTQQGDGEITFCGASNWPATHLKVDLIKGGHGKYGSEPDLQTQARSRRNYNRY